MTTTRNDLIAEICAATEARESLLHTVLSEWHTFRTSRYEPARRLGELRFHDFMTQLDKAQGRYLHALSDVEDFDATSDHVAQGR
jgi:hypothetical protein